MTFFLQDVEIVFGNEIFPLAIPQHVQSPIAHDGVNPSACRTTIRGILVRAGPDADERLLHHLFRKVPTPDDTLGHGHKTGSFTVEYFSKSVAVAIGTGVERHSKIVSMHLRQIQCVSPVAQLFLLKIIHTEHRIRCMRKNIYVRCIQTHPPMCLTYGSTQWRNAAKLPTSFNTRENDMTIIRTATIASALLAATTLSVAAAPVLGLTGDKTLVMFDTDKPAVTKSMDVTGVDKLVGIDFRPGTKTVIGVTPDSTIVSINLETGAATEVAKMDKPLSMTQAPVIVDFNPMADRLRYMTGTTNYRVHPDTGAVTVDGTLAYEDSDMHKGETPNIVAAAYTNSYGKPEKTAMYNIDATTVALVQQTKPNDGTLKSIGKLGIEGKPATYAFDIQTTEDGKNTAWLAADKTLYTVNLETGAVTKKDDITGVENPVRSIAVLPAM